MTDLRLVTRRRSADGRPVVLVLEAFEAEVVVVRERGCSHNGYGPEMTDVEMEVRDLRFAIRRIRSPRGHFFSSDPAEEREEES